jgi:nicotinate-nucleotide--dimethylbenzimidazole phosphoribosyltransferase
VPAAEPITCGAEPDTRTGACRCVVFIADHGSVATGCAGASRLPHRASDLAAEVLRSAGMAPDAARSAPFEVIELGRYRDTPPRGGSLLLPLGPGTADLRTGPAITRHQVDLALSAGRHAVERARLGGAERLIAAGRGIGTEQATGLLGRLLPMDANCIEDAAADPIAAPVPASYAVAAARHAALVDDPYELLRHIGGFEHAALTGLALAAAQLGLPALPADATARIGFVLAAKLNPDSARWHQLARAGNPRAHPAPAHRGRMALRR